MITTYTCRHCKAQCPPFEYLHLFDMYVTKCKQCGVYYRIVNPVPIVYEYKGFICDEATPIFFQHGFTAFSPIAPINANTDFDTELEKLAFLLWEAEQAEDYELCAQMRDKIKQLET